MTREEILNKVKEITCNGREKEYGSPENNFTVIADYWSMYLTNNFSNVINSEIYISPSDVALMMMLLKLARIQTGNYKEDSWIDLLGYACCGAEVAKKENF